MVHKWMLAAAILTCLAGFSVVDTLGVTPQASEVLRLYEQSNSWMESVLMKVDVEGTAEGLPGKSRIRSSFVFRRDEVGMEWRGWSATCDADGNVEPNTQTAINEIVAGGRYISYTNPTGGPVRSARVITNYGEYLKRLLENTVYGGPLWGRIFGNNHKSVADLLKSSADMHLREQQENIEGVACYVLEGTSQYGRTTVWIAPDMGYSALKWSIEKRAGDLFDVRQISAGSWCVVFDSVKLRNINGVYVPIEGALTHSYSELEGQEYVTCEHYRISDIQLKPETGSVGAFKVDLPNGTNVQVEEALGVRYVWQDGQIIPDIDGPAFEEIDRMIEQVKEQK